MLELGPGTGQATEPILNTGCDYNAIELGEHLYEMMKRKYGQHPNFHIVNDDFITHDFGAQRFDLIYSAATIQWIPEEVAFKKTFELLKPVVRSIDLCYIFLNLEGLCPLFFKLNEMWNDKTLEKFFSAKGIK